MATTRSRPSTARPARAASPAWGEALGHAASDKRIEILRRIGEAGSISEAARLCGVSYKAAWQAVETLGNLAGAALVHKAVGGAGGGGAKLTPQGTRLLRAADAMHRARREVLAGLGDRRGLDDNAARRVPALALRTSMRNQWPAHVRSIVRRGGLVHVVLALDGGIDGGPGGALVDKHGNPVDTALDIEARITKESAELLGLAPGGPVLALCKATAVRVAARLRPREGCNVLRGSVIRAAGAASSSGGEVSLRLPNGLQLVGFADAQHGLRVRDEAMAVVEASGVVIALA